MLIAAAVFVLILYSVLVLKWKWKCRKCEYDADVAAVVARAVMSGSWLGTSEGWLGGIGLTRKYASPVLLTSLSCIRLYQFMWVPGFSLGCGLSA